MSAVDPAPLVSYRAEAVAAQLQRRPGGIIVSHQVEASVFAWLLGLVVTALVCFACFARYTDKVQVDGTLQPSGGLVQLVAPADGYVRIGAAAEHRRVERGMELLQVATERAAVDTAFRTAGAGALAERAVALRSARARQLTTSANRRRAAQDAVDSAREQQRLVAAQIQSQAARIGMAVKQQARLDQLGQSGFISQVQVDDKRLAVETERARLEELRYTRSLAAQKVRDAEETLLNLALLDTEQSEQLNIQEKTLAYDTADFNGANLMRMTAPADGTISALAVRQDQFVKKGQLLLTVAPNDSGYTAVLFVPPDKIGAVQVGNAVTLRIHAFRQEKYGYLEGRVSDISKAPLTEEEALYAGFERSTNGSRVFRVTVDVAWPGFFTRNPAVELKPGLGLQADILLQERRIIEWFFSAFYSIRSKL